MRNKVSFKTMSTLSPLIHSHTFSLSCITGYSLDSVTETTSNLNLLSSIYPLTMPCSPFSDSHKQLPSQVLFVISFSFFSPQTLSLSPLSVFSYLFHPGEMWTISITHTILSVENIEERENEGRKSECNLNPAEILLWRTDIHTTHILLFHIWHSSPFSSSLTSSSSFHPKVMKSKCYIS